MQHTTLIENDDPVSGGSESAVQTMQAPASTAASGTSSMGGANATAGGVGFQTGGAGGEPVIKLGTVELGFEDVFLILIALQTLGVLVDLYGEVRR